MKLISAILLSAAICSPALADDSSLYIGAQGGTANYRYTDTPGSVSAIGVMAGYMFNRYLGLEGAYKTFGTANSNIGGNSIQSDAVTASVIFALPLSDALSFHLHMGMSSVSSSGSNRVGAATIPATGSVSSYTAGFGGQYDFTPKFGMRVMFDAYRNAAGGNAGANRAGITDLTAGLIMKF